MQAPSAVADRKNVTAISPGLSSPGLGEVLKRCAPKVLRQGRRKGTLPQQASSAMCSRPPASQNPAQAHRSPADPSARPARVGVRHPARSRHRRESASHGTNQCVSLRCQRFLFRPHSSHSLESGKAAPRRAQRAAGREQVTAPTSVKFTMRCP